MLAYDLDGRVIRVITVMIGNNWALWILWTKYDWTSF
jgi:hypothetical protein